MRALKLMALSLVFSAPSLSTTIIALRSAGVVYLAADSRTVTYGKSNIDDQTCKFEVLGGNRVFASTGVSEITQDATGRRVMDSHQTAREMGSFTVGIDAFVQRFGAAVEPGMKFWLTELLAHPRKDPPRYDKTYRKHVAPLQVLLVGKVGDTVGWVTADTRPVVAGGRLTSVDTSVNLRCGAGCEQIAYLGYYQTVERLLDDPLFWVKHGPLAGVEALVRAQIDSDPQGASGGQISVLTVDQNGVHWIKRGACR